MEQAEYYSGYGAWSKRNTTVDMEQTEHYSGYGAHGILYWNTTVDIEKTEYYSRNRADGSLLWTSNNQIISRVLTDWLLQ
jgi:hypothetical protein